LPSPPSSEPDWQASLETRHRRRICLAAAWLLALIIVCLASSALAGWVWILLFGDTPPWSLLGGALLVLEAPVFLWLARKGPLAPAPGGKSEKMAADAFFNDPERRP
jgi:hypothetical protein